MPHRDDMDGCSELEVLREDLSEKHLQNRKDIHSLKNTTQALILKQHELELKLNPLIGDGLKIGLIEKLSDQISGLAKDVQRIVLLRAKEEGEEKGQEAEKRKTSRVTDKLIAFVGLLLVLAQVYLMVKDSRRQDSIDTLTTIIQQQNKSINQIKTQGTENQIQNYENQGENQRRKDHQN